MKKILLVSISLFLIYFIAINAQAREYIIHRNIINYSKKPWIVSFENKTPIVINPGANVLIQYMSFCGGVNALPEPGIVEKLCYLNRKVVITDSENKSQCYEIADDRVFFRYIEHRGNTGSVILNGMNGDSHGGEIDLISGSWGDDKQDSGATC